MFKNENRHYSLRKLSVGLASVLIGISFASSMNGNSVKADTVSAQTSAIETKTSENKVNTNVDATKEVVKDQKITNQSNNHAEDNSQTQPQNTQKLNEKVLATQLTKVQDQTATIQSQEKAQTSFVQNSVADQSQKNLLDNLGKQKASAQSGDQAEVQENRLVDQINYKLTSNDSTDNKEDLGQNKVAPDETKSNPTTKSDAEKSLVGSGSTQKINNQSNDHADDNSQTQLNITKNSQQLNKKELATNLTQDNSTQKDYTPDINAWTGHDDGTYYILDKYTPQNDAEKDLIVIPNEADFEKADKSTNGHEIGINANTMRSIVRTNNPKEIHFSETNNKRIRAIDSNWTFGFSMVDASDPKDPRTDYKYLTSNLKAITGNSFDTSNIIDAGALFFGSTKLTNISALTSWDMHRNTVLASMFSRCNSLSDISAITNWDTSKVINFGYCFNECTNLTDISSLKKLNTSSIIYWDNVFRNCPNLVNIDAINNWNYSSAGTNTSEGAYPLDNMFYGDHKIQINIGADSGLADFIRRTGRIDAFHNSSNRISTSNTKLIELLTNTDFKSQEETTTAKRTITFSGLPANRAIPPIVQTINYTKLATAIIDMTDTSDANAHGKIVSSGFEKDWKLDTSKQNDDVIIDGVINFKPVKIPHINGYKCHLIKDPVNSNILMLSFIAIPQQSSNETQPSQSTSNNIQSSQKPAQPEQKQPEPIQTKPAKQETLDVIVVHMPDGTTKTYVQTIGFVNNLDKDLVTNKTTNIYTVDSSKSNVTVNSTIDSSVHAYRKTGNDDATGTNYKFASFVLPKIPGYKARIKPVSINQNMRLFSVSFMALPKPVAPVQNDAKPAKTVTPVIPATTEVAKRIKTEPKVVITPKTINLSNDVVATTLKDTTWQVDNEPDQDTYRVSNGKYTVELPHISNAQLHVIANDSTKDSVLFTYKGQNTKYVFNIKFVDGHYLLTTYKIKSGKLVKLIDYNFIKSSKMIDVILDWINLK